MLSLHTNHAALSAQGSITRTQGALSTSMTRLSTGYRINSAMDDAAGLQIASRLKSQTSGMAVAMRNTQASTALLQVAEGAMNELSGVLVRMKDLATQAADASSTSDDKTAMQSEYDALAREMGNIVSNTSFGGKNVFNISVPGPMRGLFIDVATFQIGASSSETMSMDLYPQIDAMNTAFIPVTAKYTGNGGTIAGTGTELTAAGSANLRIGDIERAIDSVSAIRSTLGATANRLEHVYNNLSNISTNSKAATGLIMDVDFATESASMTSNQMLMQAGTAMLKQSNSMSSLVMSLLQ
ncbi:flagellin [Massilia sp. H6]|uniref:flagellin N-terminal helical domain-containing protein n=1 Tax=Massilia sp. H6 TaxID=2970464 RepID=UPI002167D704|nr:flagellin [Massilia sp. H6]UVW29695.1 flagellin [Massilia sp. H6]